MKIIVDAMGGDNAPGAIVQGALEANRTHGLEILLVGRTEEIPPVWRSRGPRKWWRSLTIPPRPSR